MSTRPNSTEPGVRNAPSRGTAHCSRGLPEPQPCQAPASGAQRCTDGAGIPFLRRGYSWPAALRMALAADAASITIMEIVDNAVMLAIPGAMDAPVLSLHFWASMLVTLAVAGVVAFPVNRWLIARGKGHAIVHAHH